MHEALNLILAVLQLYVVIGAFEVRNTRTEMMYSNTVITCFEVINYAINNILETHCDYIYIIYQTKIGIHETQM